MKVFYIIFTILNLILLINSLHFSVMSILPFFMKEKKRSKVSNIKHKFMILIAARNEELVIENLIDSLNKQNYDKKLYQICVIPNNCSDRTKEKALKKGCIVIEPNVATKTKGEVLNYIFDYFENNKDFDTYIIFDADNIASKNFLKEINNKINLGYNVVQGFRDTKNLYENVVTGGYGLFFLLQNLFIYLGRSRINESISVNGTGYAIKKDFLNEIHYRAKTVTEDIELTCVCALQDEKIGFAKDAIFYDEQVTGFKMSMRQRRRWMQGTMQVFKMYYKELIKSFKKQKTFHLVDEYQILIFQINASLAFILTLISYLFIVPPLYSILIVLLSYIGEVLFSMFLVIYYKKNVKKMIPASLFFPIFHLSWIPLYMYACFNSNNKWEEIKHTKAITLEEIVGE